MRTLLAIAWVASVLVSSCLPGFQATTQPSEFSPPPAQDEAARIPVPPDRDLFDVARRLRPGGGDIPRTVNSGPPDYPVGTRQTFWLTDLDGFRHFTATATLRSVTPHAYMYVEDGQNIDAADIERSAREFEDRIFPSVTRYFGDNWYPGIDNDLHLSIVNARIPSVAGYFSASDEYPKQINPYSNERKVIYMNVGAVRPGSNAYHGVLAHEFQHALYWGINPNSESWINEGAAELAADITGYPSGFPTAFVSRPDTQLDTWPEAPGTSAPHYGAAMLFLKYLAQHYGGYEALRSIISMPGRGSRGIDEYLSSRGYGVDFDAVFRDWVVANYLNQPGSGRYGYAESLPAVKSETISGPGDHQGSVEQYAADYIELPVSSEGLVVEFQGEPLVRLIPDQPHSGTSIWWANRGDSIDTTLTREFDLSGLQKATLQFWAWYSVERPWDFGYVEVSDDGGVTWTILPGRHSSNENPLGNSFGPGYTGKSGGGKEASWIEDSVDLSQFTGRKVLVRFEYITDEAVNTEGLAFDDITLPELGFSDDAEQEQGWEAKGFFRTTNSLRDRLSLQLLKIGDQTSVEDVPVAGDGSARLELKGASDLRKAVLVVAAMTPVTTEPARYRLNLSVP